ncbi:MAG: hypothetical protein IT198_12850 [Acidimicrobiia bacterium]|nr:hypothetical protein [Acidimicrobiia bacterium]
MSILEAERDASADTDEDELRELIRSAGEAQGARLRDEDVEIILTLQVRYAEAKGLM